MKCVPYLSKLYLCGTTRQSKMSKTCCCLSCYTYSVCGSLTLWEDISRHCWNILEPLSYFPLVIIMNRYIQFHPIEWRNVTATYTISYISISSEQMFPISQLLVINSWLVWPNQGLILKTKLILERSGDWVWQVLLVDRTQWRRETLWLALPTGWLQRWSRRSATTVSLTSGV